jgi:DNA-binding NtrC family response regulator
MLTGLNILVLDDEVLLRKEVGAQLERLGAEVTAAGTVAAAKRLARDLSFDYALLDVHLPDGFGTDLLQEKCLGPETGVIVMTADGGVARAVDAIKLGALDYLVKPFDPAELPLVIHRAQRARQSARLVEHRREQNVPADALLFFGPALAELETQLAKILSADARLQTDLPPVLIQGETGTGKTTIARWLHYRGPRAAQPLVEINCPGLPDTLAESELFGHERGAFTDARSARMGLFEAAHGGTLFLDELGSLSLPLQAKVLTVIENHRIRRVGGNKEIPVEVRIVAASNCDLKTAVAQGRFREDLLHRLDLYRLQIPPLRQRGDDITTLANQLAKQICRRHRLPSKPISPRGQARLQAYAWPGNVRELAHELERAIVFEEGAELELSHLPPAEPHAASPLAASDWLNPEFVFPEIGFSIDDAINRLINLALQQTSNNVSAAARRLGVTRDYLRYRLEPGKTPQSNDQTIRTNIPQGQSAGDGLVPETST